MSNLKRPRTTDWAMELDLPPEKRALYQFESQGYQGQNFWLAWPERPTSSYLSQNSTSNVVPTTEPFCDHSSPSLRELLQGQQVFNNDLYPTDELLFYSDVQEFDFNTSVPAGYCQDAFGELVLATPNNDLAMESMTGKPSDVCFGTLCDVKVQLDESLNSECLDSEGLDFLELVTETRTFLTLQLSFLEEYCLLQTKGGRVFGLLNKKAFRSLTRLSCFQGLTYTALVGCDDWKERIFAADKDSKLKCMCLDVNVSGRRSELDTLAKELSRAGLFLQSPQQGTTTLPYENPQYLHIPGVVEVEQLPVYSGFQAFSAGTPVPGHEQALTLNERFPDFDMIFEELPRHDYLKEAVADFRIKTALLSHQKEAVDFVNRRETLGSPHSRSLWGIQSSSKKFQCYQHIITGAKSPTPNDFLGGILADDMGLGKSLTMLSVIVGSIARANEYAWQSPMGAEPAGMLGQPPKAAKSTLIIVPSALLIDSWIEEIDKHIIRGALRYCKYHGQDRPKDSSALVQYDVVLTTYGTLVADFSRSRNVLERINWYRMIVDEAHVVRNLSTKQFRAVNRIPAHIRWCLSGTPIQNTLADLGALVAFLGVPILKEPANFRKYIDGSSHSLKINAQKDFKNLRLLLGSICLRRGKTILPLFGLNMEERRPQFSTQEREEYHLLELKGRRAIDLAVSGHNTKETHQSVIEALLRLRLFCNHGSTQERDRRSTFPRDPDETLSLLQQSGEAVCKYCSCDILSMSVSESPDFIHLTECCRLVCGECTTQYQYDLKNAQTSGTNSCPFCSDEHGVDNLFPKEMGDRTATTAATKTYPSKLMALLEDVQRNLLQEKRHVRFLAAGLKPTNTGTIAKNQYSIVFSSWKKSLDLIGDLFEANGVRYCHVDGSLSLGKRKAVLSEFQANQEVGVLVMTLGTGAVGLNNLSIASRIYLLEPQWNPSVESQAIGRIFRLGQGRPVTIIRYIMDKTIEEGVKSKQLRKLRLACEGFDAKSSTQRIEQLQQLKALLLDS